MAEAHRLDAEVLTPEGPVFEGELFMLSTRTSVGDVGHPRPPCADGRATRPL